MNFSTSKSSMPTLLPRSELKVLVVDNDSFQLELIAEILRGLGIHDVTLAEGGVQALQAMSGHNLLILDLQMPGMDGFQFMEALSQKQFFGGLIIVSGQSTDVLRAASLVAQLQRFTLLGAVPKPVGRSALLENISKMAI